MGNATTHDWQDKTYVQIMNLPDTKYKYAKLDATISFLHNANIYVDAVDSQGTKTRIINLNFAQTGQHTQSVVAYGQIPSGTVSLRMEFHEFYGGTLNPNIIWVSKTSIT